MTTTKSVLDNKLHKYTMEEFIDYVRIVDSELIVILGMNATGKLTLANKLKIFGYPVIGIKEILKMMGKRSVDEQVIDKLKEIAKLYKKCIIEGEIHNAHLIHKLIINTNDDNIIAYTQPYTIGKYYNNLIKKFNKDLKNKTKYTTAVWDNVDYYTLSESMNKKKVTNELKIIIKNIAIVQMNQGLKRDIDILQNLNENEYIIVKM